MDKLDAAKEVLLEGLRQHSEGLYYVSETDSPFEVVHFPTAKAQEPTSAELLEWAEKPQGEKVETVELNYFLRNMTKGTPEMGADDRAYAVRFQELQAYLERHLEEVKVYRIGERRIIAFILGRTAAGDIAGLKTNLVET